MENGNRIETVALVGLGAIGSSYLARISEKIPMGHIRVIASGERVQRYRSNGVFVNGEKYFFPVYEPEDETGAADLIIFAVKYNNLKQAIADAKNQIGPNTIIMSLLNGITSEREISEVYGAKHTLLSTVIKITATRRGDSTVSSKLGVIQFGEARNKEGEYSEDVKRVKEFFDYSGISYEIHEDMKRTLWKKFMLNVGMNQTSAVLRFPYGLMQKIEPARAIMIAAMEEVVSLAAFEEVRLTSDDVKDVMARMDGFPPDGKTSMLQDVESLRPTEVGMLGDAVVALGRIHGVPVPVNETLSRLIHAIEES
ncbi:MAG: ketopantoate reductase family protein [Synergistaceae bacterium]|nr:ketopantoate reductase family protein [Synergistaceae bacterium]